MKDVEYVVYYVADRPDTVYAYYHKPKVGEQPYAVIYGYWLADPDNVNKRIYKENARKHPMLMPFDHFMDKFIPDKKCTKSFDTIEEFENDQFLDSI